MTDTQLLQQFADTGSHDAFAEIVAHHSDWIYSAALRLVRRREIAQDVTQAVFLILAQRGKTLKTTALNAWLFKCTRYCAANALRQEARREIRERRAAIMNSQSQNSSESNWNEISIVLEETVARLRAKDRDAVLLRFYQQRSMAEVGHTLGISEAAARKRVATAIHKLRSMMSARGFLPPTFAVAAALLAEETVHAGPPGLAASCYVATASPNAATIAKGGIHMLNAAKIKLVASMILLLPLIPAGIWLGIHFAAAAPNVLAISSPAPAATQPAVVAGAVPEDAIIAPFFASSTKMIVAINYSQLSNTDALVTRERKLLDDSFDPTDPHLADVDQRADQSRDLLNQSTIAFAKAGPNRLYPIVATKAGNTGGFFVIPFTENTDVEILDKSMHSTGVNVFDDHARLYDGKIMPSLRPINPADARPEFAQALASLPDAAVRIVINPDVFEELLAVISTPRTLGLGDLTDLEWVNVKCCAMSVSTTPNLTGSILLICVDHDSAESLRSMLAAKFAHLNANPPSESLSAQVAAQISNLNPQVSGNTVQFTLDQNIMEPLVADWFKNIDYRPH